MAEGQSVNFRFNTYFYGWQRIDSLSESADAKTTHLRGYQNYLLEFKSAKWSFNTLAQTEEDVIEKTGRGFAYRFYNLYVKGSNLFDVLDVKLGRQNIFAGTGLSNLDGLNLKVKAGKNKEYQFMLYGGALTPASYDFQKYPDVGSNYHFGGQFSYFGVRDLSAVISYSNKKQTPEPYTAFRADSAYNVYETTIALDGPAQQLTGIDINYTYLGKHNFFGRAYYDIGFSKLYRAELNVRVSLPSNFRAFAEYQYREPHFTYNSVFWVFTYGKNQEITGGLDYTLKNGINIFGKAGVVLYDNYEVSTADSIPSTDNSSWKLQAGFTHPNFGLTFTSYLGYAGESNGISGYVQRQIVPEILSGSASFSYSNYRIGDVYASDKLNAFSGLLGITYRPIPQFSVDLQGQFLTNSIYKTDARILAGFSYWLFKKL